MAAPYRLGPNRIDPARHTITRDGHSIDVRPQSMRVLAALARLPGTTRSRDALFHEVWGDVIVTDDALTQCIVELRRALDDQPRQPRYIQTIRGQGFQLLVSPEPLDEKRSFRRLALTAGALMLVVALALLGWAMLAQEAHDAPPPASAHRIVVLPFEDFSEPPRPTFADGLTEEIINRLTDLEGLSVIARTSAFKYRGRPADVREIGVDLDVSLLLEGSVRWGAGTVRVTAQLIDADTAEHLWSENFDVAAGDALALQDQVAIGIGERLGTSLAAPPGKPLRIDLAEQQYEARRLLRERSFDASQRALAIFDELVVAAPDSTDAWLGRASAALNILWGGSREESRDYGTIFDESLTRALTLAPASAEAQALMAGKLVLEDRLTDAIDVYRRAIALHPRHAGLSSGLAQALRRRGDFDEAARLTEALLALDPLNDRAHLNLGMIHWSRRDFARAEAMFLKTAELARDSSDAYWSLGLLYADFGRLADAVEAYTTAITQGDRAHLRIQRAALYLQLGMIDRARADHAVAVDRFEQAGSRFIFGAWERVAAGDSEALRGWLQQESEASHARAYNAIVAGLALGTLGDFQAAATLVRDALLSRADEASLLLNPWDIDNGTLLSLQYAAMLRAGGDESRQDELLDGAATLLEREITRAQRPGFVYTQAQLAALRGDCEGALAALDLAIERGWRRRYWTVVDPTLADCRDSDRFRAALDRLELTISYERAALASDAEASRQAPALPHRHAAALRGLAAAGEASRRVPTLLSCCWIQPAKRAPI